MTLADLKNNERGIIVKVRGRGAFRRRITEMGFVKGKEVTAIKYAPLLDPVEYRIMNYEISLRRSEAKMIEVVTANDIGAVNSEVPFDGVIGDHSLKQKADKVGKTIDVAFVGNPNSGKTTIFNFASSSKEHVGNYSGVTVDSKEAKFKLDGYSFNIVDLPGTYSLSAYSPEELFVRKHILGQMPDVVVNVLDASNLERNLYLTTQLIDMDIKVVAALNMYDELQERGDRFDFESLGKMIGIPFIPTVGAKGKGIDDLFRKVIDVYEDRDDSLRHIHINYGESLEKSIKVLQNEIWENKSFTDKVSSRYYAIKLLEKDDSAEFSLSHFPNYTSIRQKQKEEIDSLEKCYQEDSDTLVADAKYGFISGALKETYFENKQKRKKRTDTEKIDSFLTHRFWGFPIFFFFLWLTFQSTFTLGQYPMQWIEMAIQYLSESISSLMNDGPLKDLIIDGVIAGVGSVAVFLPNILILFFFISIMEDTGYMARVAFIMDKLMHKMGLHGKSFIPLIMGFGCNVPAIMATRTLNNRNDRLLTMLINPFMSCSARLPVYLLIAGTFFPNRAGSVVFSIYIIGIVIAVLVAILFKKTLFKSEEAPFVMELPPYRMPTFRAIVRHMWFKGGQYLQKMGGVILIAVIIIWFLEYYPRNKEMEADLNEQIALIDQEIGTIDKLDSLSLHHLNQQKQSLQSDWNKYNQENSYLGRIGKLIEPVMAPLGFDWRMGVSLLSGVAAKEIVLGTIGVLFHDTGDVANGQGISENLRNAVYEEGELKGERIFTPLVAYNFLLFILIYFPCVAVIAAIRKESGSWLWALFTAVYTTSLAWIVAFLFFQIGSLLT